jgi:hypothetical protein
MKCWDALQLLTLAIVRLCHRCSGIESGSAAEEKNCFLSFRFPHKIEDENERATYLDGSVFRICGPFKNATKDD